MVLKLGASLWLAMPIHWYALLFDLIFHFIMFSVSDNIYLNILSSSDLKLWISNWNNLPMNQVRSRWSICYIRCAQTVVQDLNKEDILKFIIREDIQPISIKNRINFIYQKELLIAGAFLLSWLTAFSVWQCEPAPGESGLKCQITGCLMAVSLFMFMQTSFFCG